MRLLMSGKIQYFTWRCISAPRCTSVTFAPCRHRSSAAMAASSWRPSPVNQGHKTEGAQGSEGSPLPKPPQERCGDGPRVLAADHQYIEAIERMWLVVVVLHFAETLAGNSKVVRQIVVA